MTELVCSECGAELTCTDSSGGIESGTFKERYECTECDEQGVVTGDAADKPDDWTYRGSAFGDK